MQYHEIVISVNRPLLSTVGEGREDDDYARGVCTTSASAIANLVSLYRRLWTLRRVNIQAVRICLTASLIHLYNLSVGPIREPQWSQSLKDLEICCEALSELSKAFNSSLRALDLIIRVKAAWQAKLDAKRTKLTNPPSPVATMEQQRWTRIGAALENSARWAFEKTTTEDRSWVEGWSQLQFVLGGDPFALAAAGYPAMEQKANGIGMRA
jgi:hypothetical protein